jgi:hypothetical protein
MDERLVALFGHFLAAQVVREFILSDLPVRGETATKLGLALTEVVQVESKHLRLQIYFALMYVVVEGYQELGYEDPDVDRLLGQAQYIEPFRRFRNGIFHYQEQITSPKVQEFFDLPGSEDWTYDLWRALHSFFRKRLRIKEIYDRLPTREH